MNNNYLKHPFIIAFQLLTFPMALCQNFTNGDLEDVRVPLSGVAPMGWEIVPFTDPNCNASSTTYATPDLCNSTGVDIPYGMFGKPQNGNCFVSGLNSSFYGFQEGIQQEISGFQIGESYQISFWQSVVKQTVNFTENEGFWKVYANGDSLFQSPVISSSIPATDANLEWHFTTHSFTANNSTIKFQFLPAEKTIGGAGVRMGLDNVNIETPLNNASIQLTIDHMKDDYYLKWNHNLKSISTLEMSFNGEPFRIIYRGKATQYNYKPFEKGEYRFRLIINNNDRTEYSNIIHTSYHPNHIQFHPDFIAVNKDYQNTFKIINSFGYEFVSGILEGRISTAHLKRGLYFLIVQKYNQKDKVYRFYKP